MSRHFKAMLPSIMAKDSKKKSAGEILRIFLNASKQERREWKRKAEIKLLTNILVDMWCEENGIERSQLAGHPKNTVKPFIDTYLPHAQNFLKSFNTVVSKTHQSHNFEHRRKDRETFIKTCINRLRRHAKKHPGYPPTL